MVRFLSPPVGAEKARAYLINLSTDPPAAGSPAVEVGTIWSQPDTGLVQRCSSLNPTTWRPINSGSVLATQTVAGQTRLTVDPTDPNVPRAVGANDPRISPATTDQDGLQSSTDKGKLDSIAANAEPNPSAGEIVDDLNTLPQPLNLDVTLLDGKDSTEFQLAGDYATNAALNNVAISIPNSPDDVGALPASDAGTPRPPSGPAGGDVTGTYPDGLVLADIAIPNYTPLTTVTNATLKVDGKGRVVEIVEGSVSGVPLASSTDEGVVRTSSDPPPGEVPTVLLASDYQMGAPETRAINTAAPLSGGGTLETDRTLSINAATRLANGSTRYATDAENQAGTAVNRSVDPAGLATEIARRLAQRQGFFLTSNGPTLFSGVTVPTTGTVSADLRGVGGIPADAAGVVVMAEALIQSANRLLFLDSANAVNAAANSPQLRAVNSGPSAGQYWVPLGTGTNAGKIRLSASSNGSVADVTVWVTGWWR